MSARSATTSASGSLARAAALLLLAGCALPEPERAPAAARPATPLAQGNEARLLVDGPATHQAMFAAIVAARDHVNLESYIVEAEGAGEKLAALLARKAAAGVKVQVIYDSVGSLQTPREYFERLRAAGVAVCEFNPVGRVERLNNRDHRKILVVDGRVAFTGGVNISRAYASGSRRARRDLDRESAREEGWRDTHVRVAGPVVAQFQRLFLDSWKLQDCGAPAAARYFPPLEPRGTMPMRVLRGDPGEARSETYGALLEAIGAARSRVWLTVGYFVPDPDMREALAGAARRGVDVRLVLPGFSDFWAPVYAGRSHYAALLAAGVRLYEWREALMHAKSALIDSAWTLIGSTNLDWRSFVHNYEADLVIHDAAFARGLERRFLLDIEAAVEVDPAAWRRRGPVEKLKEWIARQWEYLL